MNLFALPAPLMLLHLAGVLVCAGIIVSCTCRINVSEAPALTITHEQVMYLAFALWAAGTLRELWLAVDVGAHSIAVGVGIMVQLASTYSHWRDRESFLDSFRGYRGPVRWDAGRRNYVPIEAGHGHAHTD